MNAYADVTKLKSAAYLNIASVTTYDSQLRGLLEEASRLIDKECKRFFYCWTGTRNYDGASSTLYPDDILSITTLKTDEGEDGTYENTLTEDTDFKMYPLNEYPKIKAKILSNGSYGDFASGIKSGVEIVGTFGYGDGWSATPYVDAGTDVNDATPMSATVTTCTVDDGTAFAIGQTIKIGDEQLYISAISTHNLTVKRGVNGTTAASHANDSDIYIYEYPQPIVQACLVMAMRAWKRKDSAYQDVVGIGELGTIVTSKGIDPDVARRIRDYKKTRYH